MRVAQRDEDVVVDLAPRSTYGHIAIHGLWPSKQHHRLVNQVGTQVEEDTGASSLLGVVLPSPLEGLRYLGLPPFVAGLERVQNAQLRALQ